jgi:peptidoglycan/LPS O-acetylase OafA/YrhL
MLRGVAALLVVLYHTRTIFGDRAGFLPFGGHFATGYRGVDLFFVLSGFIIAHVHAVDLGRPERLPRYLFSRLTRLYPAVWAVSAFAILLYASGFGGADKAAKLAPEALLASLLLFPQGQETLVNVTWSLAYEMVFYAVFAVAILNRRAGLALLLLWQGAIVVATLLQVDPGIHGYYPYSVCLDFGIGLAVAWWVRRPPGAGPRAWWPLLAAGLASFLLGMELDKASSWSGALCAFGAGAIVLALVRLEQRGGIRIPDALVALGGASYAIYLVHFSVITLLAMLLVRAGVPVGNPLCVACLLAGLLAGFVFDRLFDRPVQRWLRRWKPGLPRPALAPSA